MVSTLNPSNQQFLNNLNRVLERMNQATLRISSGLRLQQVSDAPDQVSILLQMRAALAASEQVSTNLGRLKNESDAAEQALQNVVQVFDQVQTLAAQGVTGTQTASSRAAIVPQLQDLLQRLVALANTNAGGRFLFSGDSDQTAAYTYDPAQVNPVSSYQGSAATRVVLHPNGTTFSISLTAQEVFDSSDPSNNAFSAITSLITALENDDEPAIQSVNGGLSKVADYLNQQLAFYGATQNKVAAATDFAQTQQNQLQGVIAGIQDADATGAILELTQGQTQQTAALNAQARIPRTTLFDFLA